MNDHLFFLAAAYGLTLICMAWEVLALRHRQHNALKNMRQSLELKE